jgi:hypothetical protein
MQHSSDKNWPPSLRVGNRNWGGSSTVQAEFTVKSEIRLGSALSKGIDQL